MKLIRELMDLDFNSEAFRELQSTDRNYLDQKKIIETSYKRMYYSNNFLKTDVTFLEDTCKHVKS